MSDRKQRGILVLIWAPWLCMALGCGSPPSGEKKGTEKAGAAAKPGTPAPSAGQPSEPVAPPTKASTSEKESGKALVPPPPSVAPAKKPAEKRSEPPAPKPVEKSPAKPDENPAPRPSAGARRESTVKPAAALVAAPLRGTSKDWPMWGGTIHRNMINAATGIPHEFDVATGKNLLWTAKLGSQTYGNPVVAGGKIFVGSNNGANYRPKHKGDRGCLLTFDEKTGKFLWQLTREKLPQGRVNDWPEQGICSTVCTENDRVWVVTNRAELMCLDTNGFLDNENDGPYQQEVDTEPQDADVVWSLNLIEELGVFPHNLATSSPIVYEDMLFIVTSNGVDEAHLQVPAPRAPSFIGVDKTTGKVIWEDSTPSLDSSAPDPFNTILHGQWSSPAIGVVNGQAQVYMPGGDGWLYAFEPKTGKHIWRFDLNPKESKWELGGRGTRNNIISTPVFVDNSVLLAVGQDPEHGEGVGHLYRIDATKTGDISATIADGPGKFKPNPHSGQIWHYGGTDDGGEYNFRRTISTVAVRDGLVYAADLSGFLHCLDFQTGQKYWVADLLAAVWGSPMVVDGKVYIGDEDGDLAIFATGKTLKQLAELNLASSVYSTPTIANGVMYISSRNTLFAIANK